MNNIIELLDATVARFPNKVAVICGDDELTYGQLDELVRRLSGHLRGQWGIGPGDRVAMLMPNCIETIVVYLAIIRTGAAALPVNTRLAPPEIAFIVNDAGARALVAHGKFHDTVAQVRPELPTVEQVLAVGFDAPGATLYADMVAAPAHDFDVPDMQAEDVAAIIYTSGTTGLPKGAMLMHKNLIFNAHSTIHGFGFAHDERHLVVVPLYHVTGLNTILITSLMIGSTIVVSDRTAPRDIIEMIARYRTHTFFGVPTTYVFFLETEGIDGADLSSARIFIYSGAPMPPETILRLRELFPHGVNLVNLYGLTETTSVTTVLPAADALDKIESVGKAVPNLELKVLDAGDREVRPGEVGELCVKGDSVFKGYYNRPEASAEAFVDGWFRTGDNALIDDDGYVFLKGRKQGADHRRRRERLSDRGRERHLCTAAGARGGGDRRRRSGHGRGRRGRRRAGAGGQARRGRHHSALRRKPGDIQGAALGRVHRPPAAQPVGQGGETDAAAAIDGEMTRRYSIGGGRALVSLAAV